MVGGGGGGEWRDLNRTPTWAVAVVSAVIILISFFLEKLLFRLGQWFRAKHKTALFDALEKIKSELMVLGFISLLLTFGQNYIAKICIPVGVANTMLPCRLDNGNEEKENRRRLLLNYFGDSAPTRRSLAESTVTTCPRGKVSFVSINGLHQLHIFIFFLAVFHVLCSALTMAMGRMKIRRWKKWEMETQSLNYEFSHDPSRFRLVRETSFVKEHTTLWDRHPILVYFVCFFHQFFRSVRKADYLTLRHGFINVHLASGSKFNFRKYIQRSLEDDFKVVVGISPLLWASAVVFLLLNVHGWKELFWLSLLPPIILLAIGTDLQAIIAKMAIEIKERHAVVQGIPLVQLSDNHFWFKNPGLILFLIHFTSFMNAFQLTYFFWIWFDYGLRSCFHQNFRLIITRVVLGVIVQFMCCYVTLPLYALVSQMGSHMKRSIFDEQTNQALKRWHQAVRKRHKKGSSSRSPTISATSTPLTSPSSSPIHLLHRYIDTGYSDMMQTRYYSDKEIESPVMKKRAKNFTIEDNLYAEIDSITATNQMPEIIKHSVVEINAAELCQQGEEEQRDEEFSFVKPSTDSKEQSQDLP
ncbi:MLO-like protein 9 isoform X2 [Dendrobium catenatum]|uniref:MLO-like protein 9 isoform X2 n=1 Tax=Dendrobium catenatum TaxID=906689 RepID=UPI0009F68C68|nr:MLO-like protein 9 isoform X2 [Dendrobium catenatum]